MTTLLLLFQLIFSSPDLECYRLSDRVVWYVSYAEMKGFGRVASNGLIYTDGGQAYLFDTPINDALTKDLLDWIRDSLHAEVIGFVPNHWHEDCMGGLAYLQQKGIPSFANRRTVEIAGERGLPVPGIAFEDSLTLWLNEQPVKCYFPGPAHSMDNIVVWLPNEEILFAGCLCKEMASAGLGNTADGSLPEWATTIEKIQTAFPHALIVVPGHGKPGGPELLQHTRDLCPK